MDCSLSNMIDAASCPRWHFLTSFNLANCFMNSWKEKLHQKEASHGQALKSHFSKSNFCPKIQFWQNFTIFSGNQSCLTFSRVFHPQIFLTIFLVKSKFSTAKKSKPVAFSWVFTQNNWTIFLGKSKLNFWTKNEDFEQCALKDLMGCFCISFLTLFYFRVWKSEL